MGIFPSTCPRKDFANSFAGDPGALAHMVPSSCLTQDVLTICTGTFETWSDKTLSNWLDEEIGAFETEELDHMLENLGEVTLFHEITHAEAYFGTDGIMGKILL